MLKRDEIHIRDPFVLPHEGRYYLYGTAGKTAWSGVGGFPCYVSDDLENWEGPYRAFDPPADFWANDNFWAPEVHLYRGQFYMFASFYNREKTRATQILRAARPEGPYEVWSEPITPADWMCLDGTFHVDPDGVPYMVFCHEWLQIGTGTVEAVRLSGDLRHAEGSPFTLFAADEAPWVTPNEPRLIAGRPCMVTDGPFAVREEEGSLTLFWSSFSHGDYAEGIAVSPSGRIEGPWIQDPEPLFEKDGGHGMLFRAFDGRRIFTLHRPNRHPDERPAFFEVERLGGHYRLK